jgi:type VI secretion system protein ImpK
MATPLQMTYFNENTAGEGFFQRLQNLQQQPQRVHVLQIYYLCMALGFQGKFAVRGGEGLAALQDYVGAQVARSMPSGENVAPHGEPRDAGKSFVRRELPIVIFSIVLLGIAILSYVILIVKVGSDATTAATEMKTGAGAPPTTAPAPQKR